MAKEWFYQMMGDEVGPVSSAELKRRAQQGDILPDTLVRAAPDGSWMAAERVKGLLELPPLVMAPPARPVPPPAPAPQAPAPSASSTIPLAKAGDGTERVYHFTGETVATANAAAEPEDGEYDFFRMVGFELALGTPLHQALVDRCRTQHATMTAVTRQALAEYLGRKDLLEPPAENAAASGTAG